MYTRKLASGELKILMTINQHGWKVGAKNILDDIYKVNEKLSEDDIITITQPNFYEDLYDLSLTMETVLDKYYLQDFDYCTNRDIWIALHDIYNR